LESTLWRIREIVTLKCQEIASVEQDRLEVERIAQADADDDLFQIATQQKTEILETAKTIGYAAILMLKQLDLMSLSLNKIANDQQTQKEVLESMVKKLSGQKKAYEVQLKIKRLQDEAKELANIALNFEDYTKKFMGSFQTLLGNVANVDKELSGAMQEIKQIAEMTMNQQSATLPMNDRSSQKILDFLVASDLKKERLIDALEQSKNLNNQVDFDQRLNDASLNLSLADCLDNIQTYVKHELSPILAVQKERLYRELEQLLEAKEWCKADELTAKLMLKVANRESEDWLDADSIKIFPYEDLLKIDRLWVHYSNSNFGFSIQKKLWLECGGEIGKYDYKYDSEVWQKFAAKVGWYHPLKDEWRTYGEFMRDTKNSQNILPASFPSGRVGGRGIWLGVWWCNGWTFFLLSQRLVNCNR